MNLRRATSERRDPRGRETVLTLGSRAFPRFLFEAAGGVVLRLVDRRFAPGVPYHFQVGLIVIAVVIEGRNVEHSDRPASRTFEGMAVILAAGLSRRSQLPPTVRTLAGQISRLLVANRGALVLLAARRRLHQAQARMGRGISFIGGAYRVRGAVQCAFSSRILGGAVSFLATVDFVTGELWISSVLQAFLPVLLF